MTLPELANFKPDELDNFAQNNFMVYNWAMPVEDCKMIIEKFEQVVKYDMSQVDTFKTGHKEFTEIDIDKYGDSDFWREPKKKFIAMIKEYKARFMKNLSIKDLDFPPVIDMENIRIKKYMPNDKDQFKVHVDVVRSMGDSAKRFLVFVLYLNDVEQGGHTLFPKPNIWVKPRAGRLLVFPPFWTHPHAGLKPLSGPKYIMMSYLHYGDAEDPRYKK
jgi:thiol-disulfide isomerase/thioredoxin|tara:strand:+ start:634 stop:1284 length:651 start_codon:yes stop_codon:yes gene_type:complete